MKLVFGFLLIALVAFSCKDKKELPNIHIPDNGEVVRQAVTGQAMYKDINVAQAKEYIKSDPNLVILDVRTPDETKDGMVPNAIEIDYKNSNFDTEINKLDKSKSYLVYCKSGGRSAGACSKMNAAGFTNVVNMKGGYSAWK